jgi:hypothetical protein
LSLAIVARFGCNSTALTCHRSRRADTVVYRDTVPPVDLE